jgi:hypothetical protein
MTVINGIEIGNIEYIPNKINQSIKKGKLIDDKLHVIIVISNPCKYFRRYILALEFIERIKREQNKFIELYVVELEYGDSPKFEVTEKNNTKHLQILCPNPNPIWHKENMINMGVKHLLPTTWKAMAWIDADIDFENLHWVEDTLKIFGSGSYDILQLFSQALDLDHNNDIMQIFSSFGYQYTHQKKYKTGNINNYWHPGFGWAITRNAYDKIGGLFDLGILGSGDNHIALSLIDKAENSISKDLDEGYIKAVLDYQDKIKSAKIKLGYVPGVIRHYFHGSKKNRKYLERRQILVDHKFNPLLHLVRNDFGLLLPSKECPEGLLEDIKKYFIERNEDEYFNYGVF